LANGVETVESWRPRVSQGLHRSGVRAATWYNRVSSLSPQRQQTSDMRSLSKSNRLIFGLAAGVIVLVILGGVLLGAYLYLSRQSQADVGWVSPLDSVVGEKVAPDLAALSLAGELDERVFRAALDADEKETAFASLAYSLLIPDNIRGGHWLLLAPYCRQDGGQRASVCYQAALDLAALSPNLSDAARADLSLQAARGYADLGKSKSARMALAQVETIARYGLSLLPAQRREVLSRLVEAYRSLGDNQSAASVQMLLGEGGANPGIAVDTSGASLADLRGSVVLPSSVVEKVAVRQQAAAQVAAKWFQAGEAARDELARRLGDALIEEDRARSEFYSAASGLPTADRLALLHDQVAWLTIKYRAARGDYGVSLVSAWEDNVEEVRTALTEAYTELINGYGRRIDTLDPTDASRVRVELLRQGVLWSRLGLLPARVEDALSEKLLDASRQLWTRQGNAGLTVVVQDIDGFRFYLLSGSAREGVE
jgi:hypothetical protein